MQYQDVGASQNELHLLPNLSKGTVILTDYKSREKDANLHKIQRKVLVIG